MSGFNWPIAVYDFLGVLVPGLSLGAILALAWPSLPPLYVTYPVPLLLLAFVVGHIVQGLARFVYGLIGRLWKEAGFWENSSQPLRQAVLDQLATVYGPGWPRETLLADRRSLCYALVWDRMDNERLFTALADFSRAEGFLTLVLAGVGVHLWSSGGWGPSEAGSVLVLAAALFVLFTTRSRFFRRHADSTVYHIFLSFAVTAAKAAGAGAVAASPSSSTGGCPAGPESAVGPTEHSRRRGG